jgi:hypothetical protein
MKAKQKKSRVQKIFMFLARHKLHLFPALVILLVIILTVTKISGTSLGIYQSYLYGDGSKDSNLLYGHPQGIRSDEWLVTSQLTIAQHENDYTQTNQNFIENKNMSILSDVPYLDWSLLFKPQNLGFFIIPFEQAFALRWWFLLAVLLISAYYFTLKLIPRKIVLAILSAIIVSFSPFVFWWYQTGTLGSLAYGFLILCLIMNLLDAGQRKFTGRVSKKAYLLVNSAALSYAATAFAFLLYPPFQIPVALVIAFFSIGYTLNKRSSIAGNDWLKLLAPIIGASIVSVLFCLLFVATRMDAIKATTETVYPGNRESASGGYSVKQLFVSYLQPQLQREDRGAHYIQNQSESSNFILLPTFFLIPSIAVFIWLYRKRNTFDWVLLFIILCNLLFLAHLFIPLASPITHLFLLGMVPQTRLLIGLGFVGIILVIYLIKLLGQSFQPTKKIALIIIAYAVAYLGISIAAGIATSQLYPKFISSTPLIILLACALVIPQALIILGKYRLGLGLLAIFSLLSVFQINPLYRGLGPIYDSEVTRTIKAISTEQDVWGAVDQIQIENLPQLSDRRALSGVSTYPSVNFWEDHTQENQSSIYNRYAHIVITSNDTSELELIQPDLFLVSGACTRKIVMEIDYLVSTTPLNQTCQKLVKTVSYPARTFYIYKIDHSSV